MAQERPTETAKNFFAEAVIAASSYKNTRNDADLGQAVQRLAQGLYFECIGLRATYLLLEEVKAALHHQNAQSGWPGISTPMPGYPVSRTP
jgi:hypothetical protein